MQKASQTKDAEIDDLLLLMKNSEGEERCVCLGVFKRLTACVCTNVNKTFPIYVEDVDELKQTIKLSSVKIMELTAEVQSLKSTSLSKDKQIANYKFVIESKEGGCVSYTSQIGCIILDSFTHRNRRRKH